MDPIADDDWANVCCDLMPTFCCWEHLEQERCEQELRKQEEANFAEEEQIAEAEHWADKDHITKEECATLHALCEWQRQEHNQRVTHQWGQEQHEKDSGHLIPTPNCVVTKRKSGSSIGESESAVLQELEEKGKG